MRLGIDADKTSGYEQLAVDGINVYYSDSVPENFRAVTVKLSKLLFFKKLVAVAE